MRKCRYSKSGVCTNDSVHCTSCNGSDNEMNNRCTPFWAEEVDDNGNPLPLKQMDKIKSDIRGLETGMEMTGYLNGIEAAAIIWCKKNEPDELYQTSSGEATVTICGMADYLESIVEEN